MLPDFYMCVSRENLGPCISMADTFTELTKPVLHPHCIWEMSTTAEWLEDYKQMGLDKLEEIACL